MLLLSGQEGCTGGVLEDFPDALTSPCGALQIASGADLLGYGHTLRAYE